VTPIPIIAVCDRRHPYNSDVHGFPLSAIAHFRWLVVATGTVCHATSPKLQRLLVFFRNGLKTYHFSRSFLRTVQFYTRCMVA